MAKALSSVCVCLLPVRAKAKIRGNKYGATRSAGDYRRKVQLARLCAWVGKTLVIGTFITSEGESRRNRDESMKLRGAKVTLVCVFITGEGESVCVFITGEGESQNVCVCLLLVPCVCVYYW